MNNPDMTSTPSLITSVKTLFIDSLQTLCLWAVLATYVVPLAQQKLAGNHNGRN